MPSKRSRSKEREKKQKAREKRSKEQVDRDREATRRSVKLHRESIKEGHGLEKKKIEDTDWYAKIMDRAKVTMKEKRAKQTQDEKEDEKIHLRLRVRNLRVKNQRKKKNMGNFIKSIRSENQEHEDLAKNTYLIILGQRRE